MRAYTSFPVDDDIVDRILTSLPDFSSLRSFALSCKSVSSIYSRRKGSIFASVAKNVAGPAWPAALRTVRLMQIDAEMWEEAWHFVRLETGRRGRRATQRIDLADGDEDTEDDFDEHYFSDEDSSQCMTKRANDLPSFQSLELPKEESSKEILLSYREGYKLEELAATAFPLEDIFSQR
jgi:hypothetical protein